MKVQHCLFMALWMLLPPKLKQKRRHVSEDSPGSMNFGVAPRTERNHQVQNRFTGHPMMNDDGTLIPTRRVANSAAVVVTLQYRLTESTEMLLVLPLEGVTGCTEPVRENLQIPAPAV